MKLFTILLSLSLGLSVAIKAIDRSTKVPIFYDSGYNMGFLGMQKLPFLEKLHPFKADKYAQIHGELKRIFNLKNHQFYTPNIASDQLLEKVHTKGYLESLNDQTGVARALEINYLLPVWLLDYAILNPMKRATGGTVAATQLALNPNNPYKMAINLGGGYPHARRDRGSGFCIYNDIAIACKTAWETQPDLKILFVDLDAHQADGVELIFKEEMKKENRRFTVFDIYGANNFPGNFYDARAIRSSIHYNYPLMVANRSWPINDERYLTLLKEELPKAIAQTKPDLIFYNAGTDSYENDVLGGMQLSKKGLIERDQFVFQLAKDNNIAIVMTLSGGFPANKNESGPLIADCIANVLQKVYGIQPVPSISWWE